MFYEFLVSGAATVTSSSAGLSSNPPGAGRAAETAGGHVGSVCYPVRPPFSQAEAVCGGTSSEQTAYHPAGKTASFCLNHKFYVEEVDLWTSSVISTTIFLCVRLEFRTLKPLISSWSHWLPGSLKLRRFWGCKIPTAAPTSLSSRNAWRSWRFVFSLSWLTLPLISM